MSHEERDEAIKIVRDAIWELLHPYIPRAMIAAIGLSFLNCGAIFAAGIWAHRIHSDIDRLLANDAEQAIATRERLASWTAWRETVEERFRNGTGDRFTGTDYDVAAYLFNMKGPPVGLPTLRDIKREQGKDK